MLCRQCKGKGYYFGSDGVYHPCRVCDYKSISGIILPEVDKKTQNFFSRVEKDLADQITERIVYLKNQCGISYEELAKILQVSQSRIIELMKQINIPDIETTAKILNKLRVIKAEVKSE